MDINEKNIKIWSTIGSRATLGIAALDLAKKIDKPKAIIANTIKGKGFSFSENNNDWHHSILSKSFYEKATKELKKG